MRLIKPEQRELQAFSALEKDSDMRVLKGYLLKCKNKIEDESDYLHGPELYRYRGMRIFINEFLELLETSDKHLGRK